MNSMPKSLHCLGALLRADFVVLLKNRRAVLVSSILPLYTLFIARGAKVQQKLGGSHFLVTVAITISLLALALVGYALAVARDRERGVFQRLRVTPAPTWTIMVSRLLIQLLVSEAIAIAVLIVSKPLNHITFSTGEYLSTLLVVILESAVFLSVAQALVGLVKSASTVNGLASLLNIALFLCAFIGLSGQLGSTFQTFAKWTPVGVVISIFQSTLHQVAWNGHTTLSLMACFGYVIVCGFVGIKWFQWEAR